MSILSYSKSFVQRTYASYLVVGDTDLQDKTLIVAPTGSGKTTAVVNTLLESGRRLLIVTPTIALAKQIGAAKYDADGNVTRRELPVHYAGHPISNTEPVVVTVYDHIYTFAKDGRTLVVDEIHNLITALSYRADTIKKLRKTFTYFRHIIGLTGTHIDSRFWADWNIIKYEPATPKRVILTRQPYYETTLYAEAAQTIKHFVARGKQVFVYLPDKSAKLDKTVAELAARGVTSVSTLNSTTLRSGELDLTGAIEVIDTGYFTSKVLITTFAEGISILNTNTAYVALGDPDFVSIAQSMARLRNTPTDAVLFSNAHKTGAGDYIFEAAEQRDKIVDLAETKLAGVKAVSNTLDAMEAFIACDEDGELLDTNSVVNHTVVEYRVLKAMGTKMLEYRETLASALQLYNIKLVDGRRWPIDAENLTEQPVGRDKLKKAGRQQSVSNYFDGGNEPHVASIFAQLIKTFGYTPESAEVWLRNDWVKSANAFDTLKASHTVATSAETAKLRKLLAENLVIGDFYDGDELRATVRHIADIAGFELKVGAELKVLEALYSVKRSGKRIDGEYSNGYTLSQLVISEEAW